MILEPLLKPFTPRTHTVSGSRFGLQPPIRPMRRLHEKDNTHTPTHACMRACIVSRSSIKLAMFFSLGLIRRVHTHTHTRIHTRTHARACMYIVSRSSITLAMFFSLTKQKTIYHTAALSPPRGALCVLPKTVQLLSLTSLYKHIYGIALSRL